MLSMYQIIDKKKRGGQLTKSEIDFFITGVMDKSVPDYQSAALLMAIYLKGMTDSETADLTDAMLYSGKVFKFSEPNIIDKHSTGGIGDKTSFILAPIAAACGVKVPMIAGRGLGHTGGTVDKIEAVKGFDVNLSFDEFEKRLHQNGLVLIGQTQDIAPADKIIYALRDVTATIESVPLITASIMSKKLAEGANGIVMDIKCGSGAFMKNQDEARALAVSILKTAQRFNKKACALITNMDQPLGNYVGHSHEIMESIMVLKNEGAHDLTTLSIELAAHMVRLAGIETTIEKARAKCLEVLKNGKALEYFKTMLVAQGASSEVVDNYKVMPFAPIETQIVSSKDGFIHSIQNNKLGLFCTELGGGRKVKTDKIDFGIGLKIHKKIGDKVQKGTPLLSVFHHQTQLAKVQEWQTQEVPLIYNIQNEFKARPELIYQTLTFEDLSC